MSNFNCEKCGKTMIDTPGGDYITHCKHYPKRKEAPRAKCPACGSMHYVVSIFGKICPDCFFEEK